MAYAIKHYKALQSPYNAPGGQLARWTNGALSKTTMAKVRKLRLRSEAFDSAVTFLGSLCCIAVFHLFNFSLRRKLHPFVWPRLVHPFSRWFRHALRYYYYYVVCARELGYQVLFFRFVYLSRFDEVWRVSTQMHLRAIQSVHYCCYVSCSHRVHVYSLMLVRKLWEKCCVIFLVRSSVVSCIVWHGKHT